MLTKDMRRRERRAETRAHHARRAKAAMAAIALLVESNHGLANMSARLEPVCGPRARAQESLRRKTQRLCDRARLNGSVNRILGFTEEE